MCYVEHNVFLFTELEVLLAMVGAAGTRLKQRLDLMYGNQSGEDRDTGTIPFKYSTRCHNSHLNSAHCYYSTLARAYTSPGSCDGCPMYFVNSWAVARALGWARYP